MVRQGPLVMSGCAFVLVAAALGLAPDIPSPAKPAAPAVAPKAAAKPAPRSEPLATRPYRIRAWVQADPASRVDVKGRDALVASWRGLVRRFVGTPWDLEVATDAGPFARGDLDAMDAKGLLPLAAGLDKLWMFTIGPRAGGGYTLAGRELDIATGRLGPVCKRPSPYPADAPRAFLQLSLDVFAPFAEIGAPGAGDVAVTIQAGAMAPADAVGRIAPPGTAFIPLRVFQKPDGSIVRIDPIKFSYLRIKSRDGGDARCEIVSSLRDPLSKRVVGKNRLIALALKPSAVPTRLRFTTNPPDPRPLAGYTLTARMAPDGAPHDVGTTDREGRIVLEPGYADGLVIFRLLAGNIEPLVEFPAMPGETADERVIKVNPLAATVSLETKLNALRDEVVDLVAVRARLEARLKARADGNAWADVKTLLDEYKKLKPKSVYATRLAELRDDATKQQAQSKSPILTKTAQAQLADTEALIERYLDDEIFQAYERGWLESQDLAAKEKKEAAKKKVAVAFPKAAAPKPAPAAEPTAPPVTAPAPPPPAKPAAPPAAKKPARGGGAAQPF